VKPFRFVSRKAAWRRHILDEAYCTIEASNDRSHRMKCDYGKRHRFSFLASAVLVLLLTASCSKPDPNGDISGSVFVVTAGAGAYKLALVKLYFCDANDLKDDLKAIADDYTHQENEAFLAATKAESDNEAAKQSAEAATAKLADANAQNKKSEDAATALSNLQSKVDQMRTGVAKLIEKERPDVAKNWDDAYQLSGEITDQLYLESGEKQISLEGLVAVFGCVVEGSKNAGKSFRDQMNMSAELAAVFQILAPTSNLGQIGQDTLSLFFGQPDSVIGHALVGPDAGMDPSSGSSIQSEYETAVRASDQARIYNAILAGATHQVETFKSSHPPVKPPDNNYSLSVMSIAIKEGGDSTAKLVATSDADAKVAADAQVKAATSFHDLRAQFESLPEKEASAAWV
jgi:hypothetical protein